MTERTTLLSPNSHDCISCDPAPMPPPIRAIATPCASSWRGPRPRHVPALEASLLLMLEPVLNPVWAWVIHGEQPGAWALAGGAAILGATLVKTWVDARSAGVAGGPAPFRVAGE